MIRRITIRVAGLAVLLSLTFPEKGSTQGIYYERFPGGWIYIPPYYSPYYPPPYRIWWRRGPIIGRIPIGTGLNFGRRFPAWPYESRPFLPPPRLNETEGPDERAGEKKIRAYLVKKGLRFKMNRLLTFRTNRGEFYLRPDFQLRNKRVIEYWSKEDQRDSENRKHTFERNKPDTGPDLDLIKLYFFADKKDIYEEYKRTGGTVWFVEQKDPNKPLNIEQELDKILEQLPKIQERGKRRPRKSQTTTNQPERAHKE